MSNPSVPPIGLFHEVTNSGVGDQVGRNVAVRSLIEAVGRHGELHYRLFAASRDVRALERTLQVPATQHRISIADQRELVQRSKHSFLAWYDPEFDPGRPMELRARGGKPFPVTTLHHTLSYAELLHDRFLRLLLSNPAPYDSIICSSRAAAQVVRNLMESVQEAIARQCGCTLTYPGRYDVIPLAVDTERFRPRPKAEAREALGISSDSFVILWVGRLSPVDKADILPLLRTVANLVDRNRARDILLLCVGAERTGERYASLLESHGREIGLGRSMRILTNVESTESIYAASDVFVSPVDSLQESFGLAPIEAMASGVPQVVSEWNGYRDTVVQGETGFLVPTRWAECDGDLCQGAFLRDAAFDHLALGQSVVVDMGATQEALQRLLDSPDLRQQMSEASRLRAEEFYGYPVVVRQLETLWRELHKECTHHGSPQGSSATTEVAPRSSTYATPAYSRHFSHYPTEMLTQQSAVELAPLGEQLVSGNARIPLHINHSWGCLDTDLMQRILRGVVFARNQGQPLPIARVVEVVGAKLDRDDAAPVLVRHVLWLLKYGFLKVSGQSSKDPSPNPESTEPLHSTLEAQSQSSPSTTTRSVDPQQARICYLSSEYVSHAQAAGQYVQCLRQMGASVWQDNLDTSRSQLELHVAASDLVILHDEPVSYPAYFERCPGLHTKPLVAYAVWETDVLPPPVVTALSPIKEVWTCSEYSRQAFLPHCPNTFVVPHVVVPAQPNEDAARSLRLKLDIPDEAYVFYTITDATNPRKNLMALLQAFHRAFPEADDRVRLVVKSYRQAMAGISQLPNVIAHVEWLSDAEIGALHRLGDCYVSAHCAEAWGLPLSDAMAHGNLVVATGFSGNLEYMSDEDAWLVPYTRRAIRAEDMGFQSELLSANMHWAYVDIPALAEHLRRAHQSRGDSERQARAKKVATRFGHAPIAETLKQRVAQALARFS